MIPTCFAAIRFILRMASNARQAGVLRSAIVFVSLNLAIREQPLSKDTRGAS